MAEESKLSTILAEHPKRDKIIESLSLLEVSDLPTLLSTFTVDNATANGEMIENFVLTVARDDPIYQLQLTAFIR